MNHLTGLIYFVGTLFLHTFLKELAKDLYTHLKDWFLKHFHRVKGFVLAVKHTCWGWVDAAFNPYFLWGGWWGFPGGIKFSNRHPMDANYRV